MRRIPTRVAERWRAFQQTVRRRDTEEYELFPFQSPIDLRFGGEAPTKLFYCTKPIITKTWHFEELLPKDWLAVSRPLMPTEAAIAVIRSLMKGFRLQQMFFIGDLDPLDLTNFAILRAGSPSLARSARSLNVQYLGIDDGWLSLSERFRTRSSPEYDQDPREREHCAIVLEMLPDLEALVGTRCFALLKAGKKVELEAAYDKVAYRKGFGRRLIQYLDAKAEESTCPGRKPKRPRSSD